MDQDEIKFLDLLGLPDDAIVYTFEMLDMLSLQKIRRLNKKIRDLVDEYIDRVKNPVLRLPRKIRYTKKTIQNLKEHIRDACKYIKKRPEDCDITLDCTLFYSSYDTHVKLEPPLEAIEVFCRSGLKISLNIFFNFNSPIYSQHLIDESAFDQSYIIMLGQFLLSLNHIAFLNPIESLNFDLKEFSNRNIIPLHFGNFILELLSVFPALISQLKSFSICKMHLTDDTLIKCLTNMTQLTSFSISSVTIFCQEPENLGLRLNYLRLILRSLSKLKLLFFSGIYSYNHNRYESIIDFLPHIRDLLSNLKTLDISGNEILEDGPLFSDEIFESLQNLEELSLDANILSADQIKIIKESLPNLKLLNMMG